MKLEAKYRFCVSHPYRSFTVYKQITLTNIIYSYSLKMYYNTTYQDPI